MSLDWLSSPVSEDAPAGEDLYEADDPNYSEYYFDAVARLPEADDYVRLGMEIGGRKQPDVIFDPKSVDLTRELGAIDGLLQRSRDLRLIVLRAHWAILAGKLETCVESVEAIANVLEAMSEAVHPQVVANARDRVDAINDLGQLGVMILPLRYLDLADSGTSVRKAMVAEGKATPNDDEDELNYDQLIDQLRASGDELEGLANAVSTFKSSLARIRTACLSHPVPHTPQLGALDSELDSVAQLLGAANPELKKADEAGEQGGDPTGENEGGSTSAPQAQQTASAAPQVRSQAEAEERLVAVETYFSHFEPSSAAVLLIAQARLLIGKSLIDAFEALLPNAADRAVVSFSPNADFRLAHPKLKALADAVAEQRAKTKVPTPSQLPPPPAAPEPIESGEGDGESPVEATDPAPAASVVEEAPKEVVVSNASEASAQLKAVEDYFRAAERSSPVPILLEKARGYVGRNFESLVKDLIQE